MSGHSKWSTIKRKKGALDVKRAQVFTKMAKLITVMAKQGGGDPEMNFKLRLAIDKARSVNMPADTIARAINKGTGGTAGETQLAELVYEAYGLNGVALIIEAVTDNRNRTLSEIKNILNNHGGRLGETGSVQWMFKKQGVIKALKPTNRQKEDWELMIIEAGADDLREENGEFFIYTRPQQLAMVKKNLERVQTTINSAEIEFIPVNPLKLDNQTQREKIEELMASLAEQEDVNEVYSNLGN